MNVTPVLWKPVQEINPTLVPKYRAQVALILRCVSSDRNGCALCWCDTEANSFSSHLQGPSLCDDLQWSQTRSAPPAFLPLITLSLNPPYTRENCSVSSLKRTFLCPLQAPEADNWRCQNTEMTSVGISFYFKGAWCSLVATFSGNIVDCNSLPYPSIFKGLQLTVWEPQRDMLLFTNKTQWKYVRWGVHL